MNIGYVAIINPNGGEMGVIGLTVFRTIKEAEEAVIADVDDWLQLGITTISEVDELTLEHGFDYEISPVEYP